MPVHNLIDLTGQRFGRLVVDHRYSTANPANKGTFWVCKCDCGREVAVAGNSLRAGRTKSCGCLKNDELSEKQTDYFRKPRTRKEKTS